MPIIETLESLNAKKAEQEINAILQKYRLRLSPSITITDDGFRCQVDMKPLKVLPIGGVPNA